MKEQGEPPPVVVGRGQVGVDALLVSGQGLVSPLVNRGIEFF